MSRALRPFRLSDFPHENYHLPDRERGRCVRALLEATLTGRYTIEGELGRGGMATVWRARDLARDRPVAIKVLQPELASAVGVDRFIREIRLTSQLRHPNILPLLDSGTMTLATGVAVPWYAMPYVEGESLRQRLAREHQLPLQDALRIGAAMADALAAAHAAGIVHRDIKPENVLLSGDATWVADFGIAKALASGDVEHLTSTGFAIGTPAYMSPEQASASSVAEPSDQYSLASVIYEMLAGDPPFTGSTPQAIMVRRLTEAPRSIRPVRTTVPEHVDTAILRALAATPADRFSDVKAFATALQDESAGSARMPARRAPRRAMLVGAIVLAVLVAAGAWWQWSHAARRAPPADPELVSLLRRAREANETRTPQGNAEAIQTYGAVIGRDSNSADAWAGLARSYARARIRGFIVPGMTNDEVVRGAVAAASRAIAADSVNAEAWLARALALTLVDPTDRTPSLRAVSRALELDSANAGAWWVLGVAQAELGDVPRSIESWRRSARLSAAYAESKAFVAIGYYWARQFDSAQVWADAAVADDPTYLLAWTTRGYAAVERGDHDAALAAFEAAQRLSTSVEVINTRAGKALALARSGDRPQALAIVRGFGPEAVAFGRSSNHTAVYVAAALAAAGQLDSAMAWLARFEPRAHRHFQLHVQCDPPLDPLRRRPDFQAIVSKPEVACGD